MKIELAIDEADIGQVKDGQPVTFTVDAFPDRQFRGEVKQVRLAATNTANVVTYPVVVKVDNADQILLPGMTANAEIEVSKRQNVLSVPERRAALQAGRRGRRCAADRGRDRPAAQWRDDVRSPGQGRRQAQARRHAAAPRSTAPSSGMRQRAEAMRSCDGGAVRWQWRRLAGRWTDGRASAAAGGGNAA